MNECRRLLPPPAGPTLVIGVSGGADSTALLLALDELIHAKKLPASLVVAHLDHGLRPEAGADARWVKSLAKELGHRATVGKAAVRKRAMKSRDNLEQAARRARYDFLARVAGKNRAAAVLVAHTMDDQAETVLLNLIRGSGADGLSGIEPVRRLNEGSNILLVRPFLRWARRADTEKYCQDRGVDFREDAMNTDEQFARVRVRRKMLPQMRTFNPKIVEGLARTAELLREDVAALASAAARLVELSREEVSSSRNQTVSRLRIDLMAMAPAAVRRRALRQWIAEQRGDLRRIEMVHLLAVESLVTGNRGGRTIELPGGSRVSRKQGWLNFLS